MKEHDLLREQEGSFSASCLTKTLPDRRPPADPPRRAPDDGAIPRDVAVSVGQRLSHLARERGEDLQPLLTGYAIERLLYRLSRSSHATQFILKGAPLFPLWGEGRYRTARDLDLSGHGHDDIRHVESTFREICRTKVVDDGLQFPEDTVRAAETRRDPGCSNLRVTLVARIAEARIGVQVDIRFGNVEKSLPQKVDLPTLLRFPAPRVRAYPLETFIAEKFETMVVRGAESGRMGVLYDVWTLAKRFRFEGSALSRAIRDIFTTQKTRLPEKIPPALTPEFYGNRAKKTLWDAFFNTGRLRGEKVALRDVVSVLGRFLMPPTLALSNGKPFGLIWPPEGPWY